MRRCEASSAIFSFLIVTALSLGVAKAGNAAEGNTFIIAAAEGYGVADCLAEGGECGRVVVDAWCEAHGHGAAISFGPAGDDVTGAIPGGASRAMGTPYVVRCGE